MAVFESFGGLLRRHRLAASLTQEELAERAGLSPRGVVYLEAGERMPRATTVRRLAAALQLDAGDTTRLQAAADLLGDGPSVDASYRLGLPLTTILGRDGATAEAVNLLRRSEVRLLTLTGAAGVGKTRLAQHVADRHGRDLAHEVAAVALDGVREPELVVSAVAGVLGVRQERDRPLSQAVAEYLRGRDVLLLLDNFEQVLVAASTVVELLQAAPRLKVLVTSRAPLRVSGEQELRVPPLELTDPDRSLGADAARRSPAVALFLERARQIRPELVLDDDTARAVVQICRRLEGLPLAIELAAARLRVLTPDQIAGRLDDGLRLLGQREFAPDRQKTLRGTLDWSYELLSDAERSLFRRLGVCAGGWTIEAAEALCTSGEAVDLLSRLVEQSLVVADPPG
ncbi:MAG: helix-turn-helix domain-containing protein, partial [bacterium]|nr:helix-turn-helix domain-containing protein [bacterium]